MGDRNRPRDVTGHLSRRQIAVSRPSLHLPARIANRSWTVAFTDRSRRSWTVGTARGQGYIRGRPRRPELIVLQNGVNEYLSRLVTLRTLVRIRKRGSPAAASSRFQWPPV